MTMFVPTALFIELPVHKPAMLSEMMISVATEQD